jgi:hypothetical protein
MQMVQVILYKSVCDRKFTIHKSYVYVSFGALYHLSRFVPGKEKKWERFSAELCIGPLCYGACCALPHAAMAHLLFPQHSPNLHIPTTRVNT